MNVNASTLAIAKTYGARPVVDIDMMRMGFTSSEEMLATGLDKVPAEHAQAWRDYVAHVEAKAKTTMVGGR